MEETDSSLEESDILVEGLPEKHFRCNSKCKGPGAGRARGTKKSVVVC